MASTIRELIDDDFATPTFVGNPQSSTLHEKSFTSNMSEVIGYLWHNSDLTTLDDVFGEEEGDDEARLDQPSMYAFPNQYEGVSSEGDITRVWHEMVSSPVKTAWRSFPRVSERNQVGPIGTTAFTGTVDCRFEYNGHCIAIGELKKPGTITSNWSNPNATSTNKSRLGKELRG